MELNINKNVMRDIVMAAVEDIDGICIAPVPNPVGEVLKDSETAMLPRALRLTQSPEGRFSVDLGLNVDYGQNLLDLAARAQRSVAENLELMCGCQVDAVNISVLGVSLPANPRGAQAGALS
ncbi:Asp23/Gls24 family envelope stress response protein [Deinococcus sp. Marseille-Q6407]|uniref:Asp23/Gls24 family envelope stress response protein n=1 Tax=Deinococcus sp. Marseille-Q6407 TaxID=2969223 RepID=UPI0021C03027|nr:Asp23/Gls24 family envelope stress response protein [Deinococcus sp. Marseille-Q6407]